MSESSADRVRYGRSQKFRLSAKGLEALRTHQESVLSQRTGPGGRAAFDAARAEWSKALGLRPDDSLYLVEFGDAGRTIHDATTALRDCGPTAKDVKDATTRLLEVGFLEPVPVTQN
jgi:hypothetical protein